MHYTVPNHVALSQTNVNNSAKSRGDTPPAVLKSNAMTEQVSLESQSTSKSSRLYLISTDRKGFPEAALVSQCQSSWCVLLVPPSVVQILMSVFIQCPISWQEDRNEGKKMVQRRWPRI